MNTFGENTVHKKLVSTKYIYLNSANRNNGSNGEPEFFFPNALFVNNSNTPKMLKISLYSATVCREWYNIIDGVNNLFQYFDGITLHQIIIPEGSYSVYEFMTYLNTVLVGMTVTYDLVTNKYTFTPVDVTSWINPTTCSSFLGLQNGTTYTGIFSSITPVNMLYEADIYLNTNIGISSPNLDNINALELQSSTIIDKIPITVPPFSNIIYNCNEKTASLELPMLNNLTSLKLWISTNRLRRLTNLEQPWSVCLRLDIFEK